MCLDSLHHCTFCQTNSVRDEGNRIVAVTRAHRPKYKDWVAWNWNTEFFYQICGNDTCVLFPSIRPLSITAHPLPDRRGAGANPSWHWKGHQFCVLFIFPNSLFSVLQNKFLSFVLNLLVWDKWNSLRIKKKNIKKEVTRSIYLLNILMAKNKCLEKKTAFWSVFSISQLSL